MKGSILSIAVYLRHRGPAIKGLLQNCSLYILIFRTKRFAKNRTPSLQHVFYQKDQLKVRTSRPDHSTGTNISSINDLRNAVDDNLAASLGELGFSQSFTLVDAKLALGVATVLIAGGLFLADKKLGFEKTYTLTVVAVVLYFALSALQLYLTSSKKYKNNKFVGYNDKKDKIAVYSWTTKFDPVYHVKIVLNDADAITSKIEFASVFDAFGYYKPDNTTALFRTELANLAKKDL